MFSNALTNKTKSILESLNKNGAVRNFYLAGGTALALQFGHRQSVDLDFFSEQNFSASELKKKLLKISKYKIISAEDGTLHIILNGVLVSFLRYPYKLLYAKKKFGKTLLADWRDLAAMKLNAIANRGSKKDFIDLYFICQKISLKQIFKIFNKKYKDIKYNKMHLLKSIVYFEEAEKEPMPKMMEKESWGKIKKEIERMVRGI